MWPSLWRIQIFKPCRAKHGLFIKRELRTVWTCLLIHMPNITCEIYLYYILKPAHLHACSRWNEKGRWIAVLPPFFYNLFNPSFPLFFLPKIRCFAINLFLVFKSLRHWKLNKFYFCIQLVFFLCLYVCRIDSCVYTIN